MYVEAIQCMNLSGMHKHTSWVYKITLDHAFWEIVHVLSLSILKRGPSTIYEVVKYAED